MSVALPVGIALALCFAPEACLYVLFLLVFSPVGWGILLIVSIYIGWYAALARDADARYEGSAGAWAHGLGVFLAALCAAPLLLFLVVAFRSALS